MADPVIPDLTQTNQDLTNIANLGNTIGEVFGKVNSSMFNLGGTINSLTDRFSSLNNSQNRMTNDTNRQSLAISTLSTAILGVGNSFDILNSKTSVQSLSSQFDQLKSSGKLAIDELKRFPGGNLFLNLIENTAASSDQFLKLKSSYLDVQSSSGGLGNIFQKVGSDLSGLNDVVAQHGTFLVDVAKSTGNSTSQVADYWKLLAATIPGAADAQIRGLDGSGRATSGLAATMKLAAGTGQDFSKVADTLGKAWNAYGLEGRDALAFTAQISEANNVLGLRMDITQGFIQRNIDSFKGLTDGGNNAINVLNNMYQSFRNTGLSANEAVGIIGNLTSHFKELTIGQKAFLSAQSGGPGGLRGALQIEEQIRKGDIEGVFKRSEEALRKQFGGKIFTQTEATQSDEAASQFVRQRELLKSGAFGIKAQDDNQATRILEAFKSGTSATSALKDQQSVLNEAMNRGETLQQEGNTFLSAIVRNTENLQLINSITAFNANQRLQGSTVNSERPAFLEQGANILRDIKEKANNNTVDRLVENRSGREIGPVKEVERRNDSLNELKNVITGIIPKLSPEQKVSLDTIRVKIDNPDTKIRDQGQKELEVLRNSLKPEKTSVQVNVDSDKQFRELFRLVSAQQNVGKAAPVAEAASAVATPKISLPEKLPVQEVKHNTEHKFDVTFRGLCVDCARPIQPDVHSQARTDGAHGTK